MEKPVIGNDDKDAIAVRTHFTGKSQEQYPPYAYCLTLLLANCEQYKVSET